MIKRIFSATLSFTDRIVAETNERRELERLRQFYAECSYGRWDLQIDYVGKVVVPFPQTVSMKLALDEIAKTHDFSAYDYIMPFPIPTGLRVSNYTTPQGKVLGTQWLYPLARTVLHEATHTIAKVMEGDLLRADGTTERYGDIFDVMGGSTKGITGHFSAPTKDRLGIFSVEEIIDVQQSGVFKLTAFESLGGLKTFKIARPDGWTVYAEWRQRIGFDDFLQWERQYPGITNVYNGILIHKSKPTGGSHMQQTLIDATPASGTPEAINAAWGVGSKYIDPIGGFTIEPICKSDKGIIVEVVL